MSGGTDTFCELLPLGGKHSANITRHHILAKHLTRGSRAVRKASEVPELFADICDICHSQTRRVESKEARRYLLQKRASEYGEDHMRTLVDNLPWKVRYYELTWDALLAA